MAPEALLVGGVQLTLVMLLAADKWVHRITGRPPLEARIAALEKVIDDGNERSSKRTTELTVYLEDRRTEVTALSLEVHEMKGELRMLQRYFPIAPDDRRYPR